MGKLQIVLHYHSKVGIKLYLSCCMLPSGNTERDRLGLRDVGKYKERARKSSALSTNANE